MTITRVSVDSAGDRAQRGPLFFSYPSMSADGRFVAFNSGAANLVPGDTNNAEDIFGCSQPPRPRRFPLCLDIC